MEQVSGWSEQGGSVVTVPGTQGSGAQRFQQSFRGATVTVRDSSNNLATIYSDDLASPTAKANPFTASSTTGSWSFFTTTGTYTLTFSGGSITAPFSITVNVGLGNAGGIPSYAFASLPTSKTQNAGDIARVTDTSRGFWMDTGTQWDRVSSRISVKLFGAKGDGVTDDTTAINAARQAAAASAANNGGILYFPKGTYLFNFNSIDSTNGIALGTSSRTEGAGVESTILKNTHTTCPGVTIADYAELSNLTIDSNTSSGSGLRMSGAAYTNVHDVVVKNQTGASSYGLDIISATLAELDNVQVLNSTNGIRVGNPSGTSYINFRHCSIEPSTGVALYCTGSTNLLFEDLYIEPINGVSSVEHYIELFRCSTVTFIGFGCELFGTQNDSEHFYMEDCRTINWYGGKVNVSAGSNSKIIFKVQGTAPTNHDNVNWDGMQIGSTRTGMVIFDLDGVNNPRNINIRNIETDFANAVVGVQFTRAGVLASIENWIDHDTAATHTMAATQRLYVQNVSGNIAVTSAARQVFVNCPGTFSGTGATTATFINCATSVPLQIANDVYIKGYTAGGVSKQLIGVTGGDLVQIGESGTNAVIAGDLTIDGGDLIIVTTLFAALGTPSSGRIKYCSDCAVTGAGDNTCNGGGTGAMAFRLNSIWRCFDAQN